MRRARLLALTIILLALSGCAGGGRSEREKVLEIRAKYIGASEISITADMTADYGDRVYKYRLTYKGNGIRGEMTVLEPESIKGLIAVMDGDKISIKYSGAIIDTGAIAGAGVSPVEAFPMMISAWKTGFISSNYREKLGEYECVAVDIDMTAAGEDDKTLHRVWFDMISGLPLQGEITVNGFTVISCNFTNVSIN